MEVEYSLDEKVSMGLFSIDQRSGQIRTMGDLDREERGEHIITVSVHDTNSQPSFDTATVIVKVLDQNDNAPVFKVSLVFIGIET